MSLAVADWLVGTFVMPIAVVYHVTGKQKAERHEGTVMFFVVINLLLNNRQVNGHLDV